MRKQKTKKTMKIIQKIKIMLKIRTNNKMIPIIILEFCKLKKRRRKNKFKKKN